MLYRSVCYNTVCDKYCIHKFYLHKKFWTTKSQINFMNFIALNTKYQTILHQQTYVASHLILQFANLDANGI